MNREKAIEEKKKEIEHYEGVLDRYIRGGGGRWKSQSVRHLEELKDQLRKLQEEA